MPPARSARWSCPTPVQRTGRMPPIYSADGSRSHLQSVVRAYPLASRRRGAVRNILYVPHYIITSLFRAPSFQRSKADWFEFVLLPAAPSSALTLAHSHHLPLLRRSKAGARICLCAAACGGPSHFTLIISSHRQCSGGAAKQAGGFEFALLPAVLQAHALAPGCLTQLHFSLASHSALTLTSVEGAPLPSPASDALAFL